MPMVILIRPVKKKMMTMMLLEIKMLIMMKMKIMIRVIVNND